MAESTITLTAEQLHNLVGSTFMLGCDTPCELATSTLLHAAEELRLISGAIGRDDGYDCQLDATNVLHAIAQKMEAMAKLCDNLSRVERGLEPMS